MHTRAKVYGGYVTGIMGDEDNPQEERIDSVIEILSGAAEEVRTWCTSHDAGGVFRSLGLLLL